MSYRYQIVWFIDCIEITSFASSGTSTVNVYYSPWTCASISTTPTVDRSIRGIKRFQTRRSLVWNRFIPHESQVPIFHNQRIVDSLSRWQINTNTGNNRQEYGWLQSYFFNVLWMLIFQLSSSNHMVILNEIPRKLKTICVLKEEQINNV